MKLFTTIFAFVFVLQTALFTSIKSSSGKSTIAVTVNNVYGDVGAVNYALYDKDNFMQKPLQTKSSSPKDNTSSVTFTDVSPGNYAVVCYHDANNNGKMDFQANGMPLESYGASNNSTDFGPPNFEDSKFEVSDKDVTLEIRF